jgi:nitroreductase/NAD-dependent dihydropyrimidine dehydrogenase PreA subunit
MSDEQLKDEGMGGDMKVDRQFTERVKREILYGHDIAPPSVKADKCTGCGQCARVCPALVFEMRDKKATVVRAEKCFACGHCWAVCPKEAVSQEEVVTSTTLKPGRAPAVPPDRLQLLIRERRSVRLFNDKPVSRESLLQIVDAGRYAPTGSNRQNVGYIVLPTKDKVSQFRSLVEGFVERTFKAARERAASSLEAMEEVSPIDAVLCYHGSNYEDVKNRKETSAYFVLPFGSAAIITHGQSFDATSPFNCSVALYNCSLMAQSLGLGSCFIGFARAAANMDETTRQWLAIPKENEAYAAMVLGYPGIKYRRLIERKMPEIRWI